MPFQPGATYDARPIQQGFQDLGAGWQRMNKNKEKMDNLELSARLIAQQHPDVVDPETLEKFSKGSMGQREALVGQMTAAVANKYKDQSAGMEQQRINIAGQNVANDATLGSRRLDLAERSQSFDEDKTKADVASMAPRFLKGPDGNEYVYVPASRQLPQQTTKKMIPPPNGKAEDVVNDADGNPAYRLKWNGAKGEYDRYDIRPKSDGGLGALLGGAAGAAPAGGQGAGGGTGKPAAPAAPAAPSGPKFQVGKIYRDPNGNRARYNQDGSWTAVK